MGRKAVHSSAAERQRAYRARVAASVTDRPDQMTTGKRKARPLSRPAKLAVILQVAEELLAEYQQWRNKLPEALADTEQAESLDETIELLEQTIELLGQIQPPRGYGR